MQQSTDQIFRGLYLLDIANQQLVEMESACQVLGFDRLSDKLYAISSWLDEAKQEILDGTKSVHHLMLQQVQTDIQAVQAVLTNFHHQPYMESMGCQDTLPSTS